MKTRALPLLTDDAALLSYKVDVSAPENAAFESGYHTSSTNIQRLPWETKHPQYTWLGKTTLSENEATERIFGEERFRRLVHHSTDLICVVELEGFIKYASTSSFDILGYNSDALAGRYLHELIPDYTQRDITAFLKSPPPLGSLTEITVESPDGRRIELEFSCVDMSNDPVIKGYVLNARDITQRRLTEVKLKYQARLLSNIREAVIGLDLDQRITYLNAASEKMLRVQNSEATGQHWSKHINIKWELPEEEAFFKEAVKERGAWLGEVQLVVANNRIINAEVSITMHPASAEMPGILVVIRDIRDRKVVENVLHESVTKFRNLVNVTSDLVLQLDAAGRIVSISPKVEDLLGYSQQSLNGTELALLLKEGKPGTDEEARLRTLLGEHQPFTFEQFEFKTRDGAYQPINSKLCQPTFNYS